MFVYEEAMILQAIRQTDSLWYVNEALPYAGSRGAKPLARATSVPFPQVSLKYVFTETGLNRPAI